MYKALIDKQVANAFHLLKDLKTVGTFSSVKKTFEFNTGNVEGDIELLTLPIVVLSKKDNSAKLLVKSRDTLSKFTSVTFDSTVWIIDEAVRTDGFVYQLTVHSHGKVS
jgi:hypothetical protein